MNRRSNDDTEMVSVEGEPALSAGSRGAVRRTQQASDLIPEMREPYGLMSAQELDAKKIIHPQMHSPLALHAYRELKSRLLMRHTEGEPFVTLLTGIGNAPGTTYNAVNLASAFALEERKTALLIDCNLTNPALADCFDLEPSWDLMDHLRSDESPVKRVIHPTGVSRLRVIPSKPGNELRNDWLFGERFARLLSHVRHRYPDRYTVIDAPRISHGIDAGAIAKLVDEVLLVVPYGAVTKNEIEKAVESFDRHKLAGILFNRDPAFE